MVSGEGVADLPLSLSLIQKETRMADRLHQGVRISLHVFVPLGTSATPLWPVTAELIETSGQKPGDIPF